jgi:uncharacterized protein
LIALVVCTIAVVAVGAVLVLRRAEDQPVGPPPNTSQAPPPATPTPTLAASPTPVASPTPDSSPPPTGPPDDPAQQYLSRNPLLAQRMTPVPCSVPPRLPADASTYGGYFTQLFACAQNSYRAPVSNAGFTLSDPPLMIFSGTITTPCGNGGPSTPAFYCPSNETIYVSTDILSNRIMTFRLGTYYLAYHEYAHHIQQRIGVLQSGYLTQESRNLVSRRIELQADCFSAVHIATLVSVTAQDWEELKSWRIYAADEIHGQTESQLFWLDRGFRTDQLSQCNTWSGTEHLS